MKVFLSWSGDLSHKVACVFRDWMPSVLQSIKPYVSSEDIDKGARWSTDIAKELELSAYGVLFITPENIDAPWVNFEAGALSKTVEKSKVSPFLFNVKRSDVKGPLLQFQSTIFEKDDVEKLITSINNSCPEPERLEETRLKKVFGVWWPQLESELKAIEIPEEKPKTTQTSTKRGAIKSEPILEELLELVRNQHKILRSPEELLPQGYLDYVFRNLDSDVLQGTRVDKEAFEFLHEKFQTLKGMVALLGDTEEKEDIVDDISSIISSLDDVIGYLYRDILHKEPPTRRIIRRRLKKT